MNKKMTFEEALALLENIVSKMESGNMTLDESLSAFEEAVSLVKHCSVALGSAEQRVRMLTEAQDGTITDVPFVGNNDET